jgi:hypothetical protein
MRRSLLVVVAALALALSGGAAAEASVIPSQGHYRGIDAHHNSISFTYSRAHGMREFKVNHELIGSAQVSGGRWHHTCMHGYCTRGEWLSSFAVFGYWNDPNGGSDVAFEANLLSP